MTSNPFYLISILGSALIAFVTVAFVVESSLILFKIKQARVRAILRFLPFLSLLVDLLLSGFSIGYWLNPLSCQSCMQNLLLNYLFPELKSYLLTNDISLMRYLGIETSHEIFSVAFMLFAAITLYFTLRLFFEGFILSKTVRSLMKSEKTCCRAIENRLLTSAIQENGVKIFTSEKMKIPMAAYSKAIFIPKEIVEKFPQEEFEAIVAHELEHILWKDPLVRLFSQLLSAIFWWIPVNPWLKKLEFEQESACDQSMLKYRFHKEFLASALVKVAMIAKGKTHEALCYLSNERHPSFRRVQMMLGLATIDSKQSDWMSYAVVGIASIVGLVCMLGL
jgi:beta-lactamase regulating signal transducer with metallopeptidase domain